MKSFFTIKLLNSITNSMIKMQRELISIVMPRSSAAVGCAGATFDRAIETLLEKPASGKNIKMLKGGIEREVSFARWEV